MCPSLKQPMRLERTRTHDVYMHLIKVTRKENSNKKPSTVIRKLITIWRLRCTIGPTSVHSDIRCVITVEYDVPWHTMVNINRVDGKQK